MILNLLLKYMATADLIKIYSVFNQKKWLNNKCFKSIKIVIERRLLNIVEVS